MKIRIQPKEIEIPQDNPFKNDLLKRKESIQAITRLVGSIEGPCVLAVDAPWGTGKTTFLRIWSQHLRNQGFPIVEFNAWETDFSEDALVSLVTEVTGGLERYISKDISIDIDKIRSHAINILASVSSSAIRVATQGVIDPATIKSINQRKPYAESRMTMYQDAQEYVHNFKDSLQHAASTLRRSSSDLPLVVVIDELDRCRPPYAIELLEMAKHLFAVDDIFFVLATNRSALAHSVKVVYGSDFDAEGYLRRFLT